MKNLNRNSRRLLRPLWVPVARVLHRAQPLDRLVAGTMCWLLRKDFAVDAEPMKSLFHESREEGFKWLWVYRKPLMSILMPVYNTDREVLKKSIKSVLCQVYRKWELCIVDDASTRPHVKSVLENYASKDSRVKLQFLVKNSGIAATINKAAEMACGDYVGVLDHDDELDPVTLFEYVKTINEFPDADCIYCDEDKIDEEGNYCDPWFKSDWNPDLALSFNYVMHFALYRRRLFERLGGFRKAYEGSQDYDLLLRVSEKTDKIYHIPKILYHWRMGKGSIATRPEAKPGVFTSGLAALNDALKRRGIEATAEDAPDAWKGVYRVRRKVRKSSCSIIAVSSGNKAPLKRLLDSIFSDDLDGALEVLVCLHSSLEVDQNEFARHPVKWVEFDGSEAVARGLNAGVRHASGNIVFFLDENIELISANSYSALLEHVQREEVGAVGGKIYYHSGLVAHAGVILGPFGILGYAHRATPDTPGYVGLKNMICNYSAVKGLGMMTRKNLFLDIGGFDEELERAYWDVDYCLKLREQGYLITYTPYAKFREHIRVKAIHEMIVEPEATLFRGRWQHIIDQDPYFNPNFSRDLEDFSFNQHAQKLEEQSRS